MADQITTTLSDSILVMKFGGTSVGNADAFRQVMHIISRTRRDWSHMLVVTSAMAGVTNTLLESAQHASRGDTPFFKQAAENLRTQHIHVLDTFVTDPAARAHVREQIEPFIVDFLNFCQALSILGEATPRALDSIAALGERMSVRLLAAMLENCGIPSQAVDATELIVTDDAFQSAHPDFSASSARAHQVLFPIMQAGRLPIVTGFIAATSSGVTTTLGRGGSDYSAAILGSILSAREVWIWTDVDGVMSADPRLIRQARTIPELSYRETAEMAFYGAKVLHPRTIRPIIDAGIPLRVCNTFNPDNPGTRIVSDSAFVSNGIIKAVTAIPGLSLITVEGKGMLGVPGVAARTFAAVALSGTSVPLITQASSEQSICFIVPLESARQVVTSLQKDFVVEIANRDIDRIWETDEVVIVTVVGAGMRSTPGVAGRVFSKLGQNKVNVIAIAQGSSEVSISLVVNAADAQSAVQAIHTLIFQSADSMGDAS